jgi:amino acid adenylation domain-containing protein
LASGLVRTAWRTGVDADTVELAARLKVAAAVTGSPALALNDDTWQDLIGHVAGAAGRAEAEVAWHAVVAQRHVPADRVADYLKTALRLLVENPDRVHHERALIPPDELRTLMDDFAGPVRPLPDRRFHELFEERVRRHPDAVAAVQGDRSWSYQELNTRANLIAWSLHRQGLGPQDVVAVITERTLEWLAAVIAVFKAGGCYLPMEPHFPPERIAVLLHRSACRFVLAERGAPCLTRALADGVGLSYLDDLLAQPEREDDLALPVAADHLAYIYFTSGSTGEPKGAMCRHDGFLNHLLAKIEDLGVTESATVAQTAPQCFDISLWQLVSALLVGGRTHIVEQDAVLDVRRFLAAVADSGAEVLQVVPSYLEVLLSELRERPVDLPRLRCVSVTGEALKKELVQRWFAAFPDIRLVNAYGLTETSDDTNHEVMNRVPQESSVPLGRPIRNVRVYVVDERLDLVPLGAPGEIVFAGVCVGAGYVNDKERTEAAFRDDPHRPGERLYRSGDFGRWLPSGRLEFLGRRDSQVKVNGFRIEIGEIENRLLQVPGVRDAAVVVAGTSERPQLVAFYSGAQAPEAVAAALAESLPHYLVPQRLRHVPEIPVTANGKSDRKALLRAVAETADADGAEPLEAPATATEQQVVALWADVLKIPPACIGRTSRFTELGGTSLSAIRLAIALDRAVTVKELAHTPTVAEVAALLDRKVAGASQEGDGIA